MTEIRKAARELLESPTFFAELLAAFRRAGLVGEERNSLGTYVTATSRLLEKPLCLFIKGASGSGKNFLGDTVLDFLPRAAVQVLTSASTRSWNYLEGKLAHKVVYVKERNEAAGPVHPARLLISEKALIHWVTVKRGGRFFQEKRVTKGPIAAISTTTQDRVEVDDETRHISLWVDESPQQTRKILEAALRSTSQLSRKEAKTWHEVQALMAGRAHLHVEFPPWFNEIVRFVRTDNLWARRYFPAFLQACRTVALVRSFLPGRVTSKSKNIILRFSDFAVTLIIFGPIFERSIDRADDEDFEVRQQVQRLSGRKGGAGVRADDLVREMGISHDQAYGLLRKAAEAGTIVRANQSVKTNLKLYRPAKPRPFLPDPAEIFQELDGAPRTVRFTHPLSGKRVIYRRR